MIEFYVSTNSLSSLSSVILTLIITLYFLSLKNKSTPIWLLLGFFASLTSAFLATGLSSLNSTWQRCYVFLVSMPPLFLLLGLLALVEFVYQFPRRVPDQYRESRYITTIFTLCLFIGLKLSWEFNQLPTLENYQLLMLMIVLELFWIEFTFVRRMLRFTKEKSVLGQLKVLMVSTPKEVKALRLFFLVLIFLPIASIFINMFSLMGLIDNVQASILINAVNLFLLFVFVLAYLNYATESITIMVKLVGISLVTMLLVLNAIGRIIAPFFIEMYTPPPMLASQHQLHFQPNTHESYDITTVPFHFDPDLGEKLTLNANYGHVNVTLPFAFPFYQQPRAEVQIFDDATLTFIAHPPESIAPFTENGQPAIYAFFADLDPTAGGGVFYKQNQSSFTVTWYQLPIKDYTALTDTYTIQVTLYKDGAIDFAYQNIPNYPAYPTYGIPNIVDIIGLQTGNGSAPSYVDWVNDLPYQGVGHHSIIQNYQRHFLQYMNRFMRPLAIIILITSFFIIAGFPLFFHSTLVNPLTRLAIAAKKVNEGNFDVQIPMEFNDEFGYVTHTFNSMVKSIKLVDQLKNESLANSTQREEIATLYETLAQGLAVTAWAELVALPLSAQTWESPILPTQQQTRLALSDVLALLRHYDQATNLNQRTLALNRANSMLKELSDYVTAEVQPPEQVLWLRLLEHWRDFVATQQGQLAQAALHALSPLARQAEGFSPQAALWQQPAAPFDNPYIAGRPVTPPLFVGRNDIYTKIAATWSAQSTPDSIILYGHRRMGKSSILRNIPLFIPLTGLFVYSDLSGDTSYVTSAADLILELASKLHYAAQQQGQLLPEVKPSDYARAQDAQHHFNRLLEQVAGRVYFALDEFEAIDVAVAEGRMGAEIYGFLRSYAMGNTNRNLTFILGGLHTLEEMSQAYHQAFFGSYQNLLVSYLSPDTARSLITNPTEDFTLNYEAAAVARIIHESGGQPLLIQQLCREALNHLNHTIFDLGQSRPALITLADVEVSLAEILSPRGNTYFLGVWAQLTEDEPRHLIRALAQRDTPWTLPDIRHVSPLSEEQLLAHLTWATRHDLLRQATPHTWQFCVPLMRQWVAQLEG